MDWGGIANEHCSVYCNVLLGKKRLAQAYREIEMITAILNLFRYGYTEKRVLYDGNSYPEGIVKKFHADNAKADAVWNEWESHFPKDYQVDKVRWIFITPDNRLLPIDKHMASRNENDHPYTPTI